MLPNSNHVSVDVMRGINMYHEAEQLLCILLYLISKTRTKKGETNLLLYEQLTIEI